MRKNSISQAFLSAFFLISLACGSSQAQQAKRLLILGQGNDGHPPASHEFMAGAHILAACLQDVPNLQLDVVQADGAWKEGPALLEKADGAVLYLSEGAKWIQSDPRRHEAFAKLAARGGGLVGVHWAVGAKEAKFVPSFLQLLGACHGGPDRKYRVLEQARVEIAAENHPVCRGMKPLQVNEEFYYKLKTVEAETAIIPLLTTQIEGEDHTICWAWERPGGGRSCGFTGGHFHKNWREQSYRRLISQAALWTLDLPIPKEGLPVMVEEKLFELK